MEKLIVKNFGPIKEAEIDLTKFVVFIGDTSTGKSVLGKLISIFRDFNSKIILFNEVNEADAIHEFKKYNINFIKNNTKVIYVSFDNNEFELIDNKIVLKNKVNTTSILEVSEILENNFEQSYLGVKKEVIQKIVKDTLLSLQTSIYIPVERVLFSVIGNSLSGLMANNVALPECYKNFAAKFEVARIEIKNFKFVDFNLEYIFDSNLEKVRLNGIELQLNEASSGIQSIIPLLLVVENEIKDGDKRNLTKPFLIEEPELSLYPIKQKLLMEYLVQKINRTNDKLIITTHSPYILSSLDTLMLAKNVFNENPDLKDEISAIVSEDKWLDYKDISVYEVRNDGKVYSIKNEEFKSIDTNAIDSVSDVIMEEFDKLTELRYATH